MWMAFLVGSFHSVTQKMFILSRLMKTARNLAGILAVITRARLRIGHELNILPLQDNYLVDFLHPRSVTLQ
jgi:hypothetical protein